MRRRRLPAVLVVGLALLAGPTSSPAIGQATADRTALSPGPEVYGTASVLAPLARLNTTSVSFGTEVSSTVGISAGGVWWLSNTMGFGVHGVWAPAQLNLVPSTFTGVVPDDLGDADYAAGLANVVLRLPLSGPASPVEPFVALGAGVRDLQLQPQAAPESRSATDFAATAAVGAAIRAWDPVALRIEVRDVISEYDSTETGEGEIQNDVLVSVGVSYRP